MTVHTGKTSDLRVRARLTALALGAALIALPGAALAQQDEHHRDANGGREPAHQPEAARPAPAAAAPRAIPAPAERGSNPRGAPAWDGQPRGARGNLEGNGGPGRQPQPNLVPGQGRPGAVGRPGFDGRPAYQGQPPRQGQPGYQGQPGRNDNGAWRNDSGPERNDRGPGRFEGPGRGGPGYGHGPAGGQWSHNWRQDNRYDWRGWRNQNRDAFRAGRYYAPYRGYSYNRLGVGFYLQPLFFGSDYWITDPMYYRLPPAYGPYHWVRYYNDVILVNTYTGQVADVIYDFFW